jgi:protein-tyrosine phosphatase
MSTARRDNLDCGCRVSALRPSVQRVQQFVDMHCHCLPDLDDGPGCMDEALDLCATLVEDKVRTVVATPHQLGCYENRTTAQRIRKAAQQLNGRLAERDIDLTVLPGAEVRLDERICELLARRRVLTLADVGRHILLELPSEVFIDVEPLLMQLVSEGVDPIIAHPERNRPLLQRLDVVPRWLSCGISLQVTAASLTGHFGPSAQRAAAGLIAAGWVDTVATDAHGSHSHPPRMTTAYDIIAADLGDSMARLLCMENPSRIVRGEQLVSACGHDRKEIW